MAISFRGLVGGAAAVGVLKAISRRLGRSSARRDERERADRQTRRDAFSRSEAVRAQGFKDQLASARSVRAIPEDVLQAKRRSAALQREARRANFDRGERTRTSNRENRTILAKVGSSISSVFDLFGLRTIGKLVRQHSRGLTFGDVIRKVVSNKFIQAYAGALAYQKYATLPQPPETILNAVSLRSMELIGERWLSVAKGLCPSDSGRLRNSLSLEFYRQKSTKRAHYGMAIVSNVAYFEEVNSETGFVAHAFQSIRREIPAILRREISRAGGRVVNRRVQVKLPDIVRVGTLSKPVRVSRLPRFITGRATNV